MPTASTKKTTAQPANKPVQVFRARGVKISVFENQAGDNVVHKTTIQRIYREGDDWKTTTSLSRDDLPVARHLLQKAWEFILEKETAKNKGESEQ